MSRQLSILIPCLLFWLSPHPLAAQIDYVFRTSEASSELSQQTVRGIFEDKAGFLWLLTQEGLNRFDGYEVIRFRASNRIDGDLTHQSITSIAELEPGLLWIGTAGGGLNLLDTKNFTFSAITAEGNTESEKRPLSNLIMALHQGSGETLWVGYGDGAGISKFDPKRRTFTHFSFKAQTPAATVRGFAQSKDGTTWIAVENAGLFCIKKGSRNIEQVKIFSPENNERAILDVVHVDVHQETGDIWLATLSHGVIKLDDQTTPRFLSQTTVGGALPPVETYSTKRDGAGRTWIGASDGIYVLSQDGHDLHHISRENSALPDDQVLSIHLSEQGIVWAGTYSGLAKGTPTIFARYDSGDGLPQESTNAFAQTADGTIWIATDGGIAYLEDTDDKSSNNKSLFTPDFNLPANRVMSLTAEGNNLWAGTINDGLFFIDRDSKKITHYERRITDPNSLSADGITSILVLPDEKVLIGTYGGGLNLLNRKTSTFSHFKRSPDNPETISSDRVIALLRDSDKNIWVGTENGLNYFNLEEKKFKRFTPEDSKPSSLSSDMAWALYEDADNNLWIGTQSGGLNKWSLTDRRAMRPNFVQYSENVGLPSADIYTVLSDEGGNIWMSHNRGVSRLNPDTLAILNFDQTDGLQGPEFNHGAAFKDKSENLYFGGIAGFNVVDPGGVTGRTWSPPVRITSVTLLNEPLFFDRPYSELTSISLPHDYEFATISFSAIDFKNPRENLYRYRFKNRNSDWIELGSNRQVALSGFSPGLYELVVQGSNSDGHWSENNRELRIEILPPFWQTKLAYAVYLLISAVLAMYLWRLGAIKRRAEDARRRELEKTVLERTNDLQEARIAAENATKAKSDFLAAMSHEIRTPMHGMLGMTDLLLQTNLSSQQRQFADAAKKSGESLLALVTSILDFSKLEANKIEFENVEVDIRSIFEETLYLQSKSAAATDLSVYGICSSKINNIFLGDPSKIRQIINNLVGNATKFTQEGYVLCSLTTQKSNTAASSEKLCLTVKDTGIGMNPETIDRIFDSFTQADASTTRNFGGSGLGLTITKELIERMGGQLQCTSELGVGTTFSASIDLEVHRSRYEEPIDTNGKSVAIVATDCRLIESLQEYLVFFDVSFHVFGSFKEIDLRADEIYCVIFESHAANGPETPVSSEINIIPITRYHRNIRSADPGFETPSELSLPLIGQTLRSQLESIKKTKIRSCSPVNPPPLQRAKSSASALRALVVEDVQVNQEIAKAMLDLLDAATELAENGRDAIEKTNERDFDIVFMDCQMPVMDGFEAAVEIRKREAQNNAPRTPIIALTAGGSESERGHALAAGMDDYITKPFTLQDLKASIERFVEVVSPSGVDETARPDHIRSLDHYGSTSHYKARNEALMGIISIERQTGNRILPKLLHGLREQSEVKVSEIRHAIQTSDRGLLRTNAHAIKSMSASVGAELIRSKFEEMEKNYQTIDFLEVAKVIEGLPTLIDSYESEALSISEEVRPESR